MKGHVLANRRKERTKGTCWSIVIKEMQRLRLFSRSEIIGRGSKKGKTFTGYKITHGEAKSELRKQEVPSNPNRRKDGKLNSAKVPCYREKLLHLCRQTQGL